MSAGESGTGGGKGSAEHVESSLLIGASWQGGLGRRKQALQFMTLSGGAGAPEELQQGADYEESLARPSQRTLEFDTGLQKVQTNPHRIEIHRSKPNAPNHVVSTKADFDCQPLSSQQRPSCSRQLVESQPWPISLSAQRSA